MSTVTDRKAMTCLLAGAIVLAVAPAMATTAGKTDEPRHLPLIVELEDLRPPGLGFFARPMYVLHDGRHAIFRQGEPASEGLRLLANEGPGDRLFDEFQQNDPQAIGEEFCYLPLHFPRQRMNLENTARPNNCRDFTPQPYVADRFHHRYLSFATKLIPSDDAFIANEDPQGIELFDEDGRFLGPIVVDFYGFDVMDAGTRANEESDVLFLHRHEIDEDAGTRTAEPVRRHPGFNGSVRNLDARPVNILGGAYDYELPPLGLGGPPQRLGVRYEREATDFTAGRFPIARLRISTGQAAFSGFNGSYYDPVRDGEGVTIEVIGNWPDQRLAMTWYTYRPDDSGDPMFLVGVGEFLPNEIGLARVTLYEARGGRFASTENPTRVEVTPWGEVDVRASSGGDQRCRAIVLSRFRPLDPLYEVAGDWIGMQRLSPTSVDVERHCPRHVAHYQRFAR